MKNLLLFLLFSLITASAFAQPCGNGQSQIDIHGNRIKARILSGGDLFTDLNSAQFFPDPDPNEIDNPATIFAAGIWMGGVDPAGNLKLAAVDYRANNKYDFTPGPLSPDGVTNQFSCLEWDRHFRVTGNRIQSFLQALPLTDVELITQYRDIAGWPGRGNPFFQDVWGYDLPASGQDLAPYNDANADGLYNPLDGDYPAVLLRGMSSFVPAEIVWCVFNDQNGGALHSTSNGKAIQAEFQLTVWAFNCDNEAVVNNTLFTSHKIINRSTERMDSTYLGIWVDVDLGCYSDDYVGCNTDLNTMYGYNQDPVDGQPGNICVGVETFPAAPPVQSITLLNHPLSNFVTIANSSSGNPPVNTTDPNSPGEYYSYMTGTWKDGSPLTYGGNGYGGSTPTNHLFPSDPADPNGWSMCTANLAFGDRRMLGTTKLGSLDPGKVEELVIAWAFHPNPDLPCGLGSTFSDVTALHNIYDKKFQTLCSPLRAPDLPASSLTLFPNPSTGTVVLQYGNLLPVSLKAFDSTGKLVLEKNGGFAKEETLVQTGELASGVYNLQIITEKGTIVKKLAIQR